MKRPADFETVLRAFGHLYCDTPAEADEFGPPVSERIRHIGMVYQPSGKLLAICSADPNNVGPANLLGCPGLWRDSNCPECRSLKQFDKRSLTKRSLMLDKIHLLMNFEQMFIDAMYWNFHNPDEEPINPDPDGQLAEGWENQANQLIKMLERCRPTMAKHAGRCGWPDELEEEVVFTPHEKVLSLFVNKADRGPRLPVPFLLEGKVVSTNGRVMCWVDPEFCNETYEPAEKLPSGLEGIFHDIPFDSCGREITYDAIAKTVVERSDFLPSRVGCVTCGDSGSCYECECGTAHECGKCDGAGSIEVKPKKLLGIGTGTFQYSDFYGLLIAVSTLGLDRFKYLGSSENKYLQHFRVGDCYLIMFSARLADEQERVIVAEE